MYRYDEELERHGHQSDVADSRDGKTRGVTVSGRSQSVRDGRKQTSVWK